MQVIVKARHTTVTPHLKELATHKLERVQRFLDRIQTLEVEFSEEHNPRIADKHSVEVTLTTKAHTLRAHASGPDPHTALDFVVDKLEAQVKKLKDKKVSRWRGALGHRRGDGKDPRKQLPPEPDALFADVGNGSERPIQSPEGVEPGETGGPRITRVTRFTVKPMTAEEAVLQMETLGHDFYLFVNAESDQGSVVYRRADGSFGLIEPD